MVPPPPPSPSQVQATPQLFRNTYKATRDILLAAKAALKAVPVETAPVEGAVCDPGDHVVKSEVEERNPPSCAECCFSMRLLFRHAQLPHCTSVHYLAPAWLSSVNETSLTFRWR